MPDYNWVTRRLAVGAELTSLYDARKLAADGFTHVLNLRHSEGSDAMDGEDGWCQKAGLSYAANPTPDDDASDDPKPPEWFQSSYDFVMGALSRPGTTVLVHCQAGLNRGPSTIYFILRAWGFSKDYAYDCIATARPKAAKKGFRWNVDADSAVKAIGF